MNLDRTAVIRKFGDEYVADELTYIMGIDQRFSSHIAERFKGQKVLETCTGAGFTTIALAKEAAHVVTIEINPSHQAQARKNIKKADLCDRVTFVEGDALDHKALKQLYPFDSAFLDPDWAVTSPQHVFRFRKSNTRPPADELLQEILMFTPNVALVLPPFIDIRELEGIPAHERQALYFGKNQELYCLYFGNLAQTHEATELHL